jgi:2,5-diketo-D-gluconate reductase A
MASFETRVLHSGVEMPVLGVGVYRIPEGAETERVVGWALEAGYRHVDTAQVYGNEASVGRALAAAGISRDHVFVTTKFDPWRVDPVAEAERSRERLGIDRLDLYLVHWPQDGPTRDWPGMERALERGLTRAIGVSNFSGRELAEVADAADAPPDVNQVRLNPFEHRRALVRACDRLAVAPVAYSPLTVGRQLDHPVVVDVARRAGRTPTQVLLRWGLERGFAVIPKSVRRERLIENSRIFDFSLTGDDLAALDSLDRTGGTAEALERRWWRAPGVRARRFAARLRAGARR